MQKIKNNFGSYSHKKTLVLGALSVLFILGVVMATHHTASQPQSESHSTSLKLAAAKQTVSAETIKPSTPASKPAVAGSTVTTMSPAAGTATPTPAASIPSAQTLYTNPQANVAAQARAWAAAYPSDANKMNRLAATPMANWFGGWSGDIQTATNNYVSSATAAGQIAVLVAYNIPQRDCGSYSAGGAGSSESYKTWISALAGGIGQRQAIVILEPDALAGMDCLSNADQQNRLQLLNYAVQALRATTKAAIYLDAGNPTWQSVKIMADRLTSAGISNATGFSLNVSNFQSTASNNSYGAALSRTLGGKHFVIDTSRNGNGPASGDLAWCNPDGRAFGISPTLQTGNALADAYLWLKSPGESDGTCGPAQQGSNAPAAGSWWPQYILMLANNSGW